ncbi:MAG: HEAT repeat domain-containing protein [Bacteroidales bacterium]|nr:HEAT repeat domain-containing protein [Candidatus Latescibacterota bacterium]
MNGSENTDDLILEYVSAALTPARKEELEALLAGEGYDIDELREMALLYDGMADIDIPAPSEKLGEKFYAMIDAEKGQRDVEKERRPFLERITGISFPRVISKLAYAAVFIVIGWTAASMFQPEEKYEKKLQYMASEVNEMKKMMMFSMLNRKSASERLQAVQYLRDLVPGDEQVLTAMLDVFERDPNVNVRLATLDALSTVEWDDRIREGLISNIEKQDSPLVQLALVDVMVSSGEDRAVEPLRQLLLRKDLNLAVRSRVSEGLRYLL